MKELELLNLTEDDFKMLNDALECLPSKNMAGELMGELLISAFSKGDGENVEHIKAERDIRMKKAEKEKQLMVENIRILQGKVLMLQRHMRMNGLLKDANDIIHL